MVTTRSLPSRSAKPCVIVSLVVALVLGLDQLSKQWALTALGQVGTSLVLPGPVDLTLVLNYSNAFGLVPVSGELTHWRLTALNLTVASILVGVVLRQAPVGVGTVGLAFIIAGVVGNLLDRIRFGAVIDLVNASKLGFIWVFTVADVSIDMGVALLLAAFMIRPGSDV